MLKSHRFSNKLLKFKKYIHLSEVSKYSRNKRIITLINPQASILLELKPSNCSTLVLNNYSSNLPSLFIQFKDWDSDY